MRIIKIIFLAVAFFANTAHSQAVHGYLDSVIYSEIDHSLAVFGWAASEKQNIVATNILIDMDGMQIYQGRMLRS